MKRTRVLFGALASMSLLTLAIAVPAFADDTMVANTPVNVRQAPDVDSAIIGWLSVGDKVQSQGLSDGWYKVTYNGQTAYVYSEYLTFDIESTTVKMVTTADLNLRTDPTTAGDIMTSIPQGTTIDATPSEGGWYKASYNGMVGYVYGGYLETAGSSGTPSSTTKMVATGDVYVRDAPSIDGNQLGVLKAGDTVDSSGKSGDWYIVSYNGKTGYVYSDWLKANTGSTSTAATTKTATTTVNIRNAPDVDSTVVGWLQGGSTISVTGTTSDGWCIVDFHGTTAYIYGDYLK